MARLIYGIIIGIILSFFSVSLFTQFQPFIELSGFLIDQSKEWLEQDPFIVLRLITIYIEYSFNYDLFSLISGSSEISIYTIITPVLLSWIFVGLISGMVVRGVKRGIIVSSLTTIIFILIWILIGILAGRDLMNLFQGINLLVTLGGVLGALIGCCIGGFFGGAITGPYEGPV